MKLEIQRTLVLSTGHITEKDGKMLDVFVKTLDQNIPLIVDAAVDGWRVHTDILELNLMDILKQFSSSFLKCLLLAYINDCEWINFDADGLVNDFMEQHEW
jgi:hypothetical protein